MAKKIFTDESLSTFVEEVKKYTDDKIASYISYIISKNLNDFNAVQFIGTSYVL